jgi:hypothetical protein
MTVDDYKNILDSATDDEILEYLQGLDADKINIPAVSIARDKVSFTAKIEKDKQFVDNFVEKNADLLMMLCPGLKL